ncbi:hypothetical protein DY000_02020425 [Brassica cretica]|uniref:Uncharacterized protein n=1 Tax=Brassica cretica TaxID=69181 RepID=A0ABQ7E8P3_BRACR|nr:hypothetical protein DY000_02020425 [Brassica cretica]
MSHLKLEPAKEINRHQRSLIIRGPLGQGGCNRISRNSHTQSNDFRTGRGRALKTGESYDEGERLQTPQRLNYGTAQDPLPICAEEELTGTESTKRSAVQRDKIDILHIYIVLSIHPCIGVPHGVLGGIWVHLELNGRAAHQSDLTGATP